MKFNFLRRTNYLIDRRMQLRYTIMVILIIAAVVILGMFGLYYTMWTSVIEEFSQAQTQQNLEEIDRIAGIQEARQRSTGQHVMPRFISEADLLSTHEKTQLYRIMQRSQQHMIPKIILVVVLIGIASIFITHRIAGPLFRIRKELRMFNEGQTDRTFRLRKGDQFQDIAGELNKVFERQRQLEKNYALLKGILTEIVQEGDSVSEKTQKNLKDLLNANE